MGRMFPVSLTAGCFTYRKHFIIYKAVRDLQDKGINPDILPGQIDSVGGPAYVASLTDYIPPKSSVAYYVETITKECEKRKTQTTLLKALEEMGNPSEDTSHVIQNLIKREFDRNKPAGGVAGAWSREKLPPLWGVAENRRFEARGEASPLYLSNSRYKTILGAWAFPSIRGGANTPLLGAIQFFRQ
jgi:hypothetical protein